MDLVVTLNEDSLFPEIAFSDCHIRYDTDMREWIVLDLNNQVQAIYDAERLTKVIIVVKEVKK